MTEWTQEAIERRIQDRIREPQQPLEVKTALARSPAEVVVTDIHMSFGSMVTFMVKWALASIPALLILFFLALFGLAIFGIINKH